MNAFDAWLVVVGLAIGAGLAWLVMLDLRRRDDDIAARESRAEAAWIADVLRSREIAADAAAVEEVLRLHRAYLAGIPDDGAARPMPAMATDAGYDAFGDDGEDDLEDDHLVAVRTPRPDPVAGPAVGGPSPAAATAPAPRPSPDASEVPGPSPAAPDVAGSDGEPMEPAWADEDLEAAHEALDALLSKRPPDD